ncbi:MAG: DUF309 domain-containing protein [Planctomycetota bacterium]
MSWDAESPPRYTERTFPPYSYVAGFTPHPVSHPDGHMHNRVEPAPTSLDPTRWQECEVFRYAVDLFNHGYYWEAHEAWETLWLAADRAGPIADFCKGLIKLAAAGVKAREGNPRGVRRHAARSAELVASVQNETSPAKSLCGLPFQDLLKAADTLLNEDADAYREPCPERMLPLQLVLSTATK